MSKNMETGTLPDSESRTLLTRSIHLTTTRREWLERWDAETDHRGRYSLLHNGFEFSPGSREELVSQYLTYLDLADGWADHCLLRIPEDRGKGHFVGYDDNGNEISKEPSELRQELAQKAFDMLCGRLFKLELENSRTREVDSAWSHVITSERLFPAIQRFFRIEKRTFGGIGPRNLSPHRSQRSNNEKSAVAFLVNLARWVFGWKEEDTTYASNKAEADAFLASRRATLDAAKPWLIEVLVDLHRLDVLKEWMLRLDKACVTKLKEIAMRASLDRYSHHVMESRLVRTLDEACYAGSKAAWFLKERELKLREQKRLLAILNAEHRRQADKERVKKLGGKRARRRA